MTGDRRGREGGGVDRESCFARLCRGSHHTAPWARSQDRYRHESVPIIVAATVSPDRYDNSLGSVRGDSDAGVSAWPGGQEAERRWEDSHGRPRSRPMDR